MAQFLINLYSIIVIRFYHSVKHKIVLQIIIKKA